jgi:hypothetical protein
MTESQDRLPQRFRYRVPGRNEWDFGVCFPVYKRWQIQTGDCVGSFESDPWEMLGHILGDVEAFQWIDNGFGWSE